MMLTFVEPGQTRQISRITGKDETKQYLSNLGFVSGASVTVVSKLAGNFILKVKDSRVALDQSMARRIDVVEEVKK